MCFLLTYFRFSFSAFSKRAGEAFLTRWTPVLAEGRRRALAAGAEAVVLASWWLLAALCARGAPGLLLNGPVAAEDGGLEEEVRLLLFPERHDALPLLARGGMN